MDRAPCAAATASRRWRRGHTRPALLRTGSRVSAREWCGCALYGRSAREVRRAGCPAWECWCLPEPTLPLLPCVGSRLHACHACACSPPEHINHVTYCREELPESVTGAAYDSPSRAAGAVAEYCLYLYERQLQRERQPELTFQLPDPLPALPEAAGGPEHLEGRNGRAAGGRGKEVVLRVEWRSAGGSAGLRFWRDYALTDNQVGRGRR